MKKTLSILLLCCLLLVSGCTDKAGASSQEALASSASVAAVATNPYKGTPESDMVTVDIQSEPPALNSMISSDSVASTILSMSMTGLMKLDENGHPVPGISESYDVSEDKKTYTFHLRENAKWSNGAPVTAGDFLFAWRTILDPKTGSPGAYALCDSIVNAMEVYSGAAKPEELGVKAVDAHTLQVELLNPAPYALTLFAQAGFLPVNQAAYEEIGADSYGTDAEKIVTNGAYLISEWVHDSHVLMAKNDKYFDAENIRVPKVKYVMLGDENARINAFKTGQLDMFDVFGSQIELLSKDGDGIINAYYDNAVFCFQYNRERKVTANPKICQALAMAIDTKSLCDNIFKDGSIPADGLTPPTISGANDETFAKARGSLVEFDAEKAKQLFEQGLKELGTGADSLNLTYTANNSSIGKMQAEYFQQQWSQNLGVKVEVELMEWNALLQAQQSGDFDLTFSGWGGATDDALDYLVNFESDSNSNVGRYNDPKYDELLTKVKKEADPVKRQNYMIEAEQMLVDSGAALPLYYTRIVYASSAKVKGVVCTGYQKYDFTNGAEIVK